MTAAPEINTDQTVYYVTGNGLSDTHAKEVDDRENRGKKPNPHPLAGQPYHQITGPDIAALVEHPAAEEKTNAPWFIASTYNGYDARSHDAQREKGEYWVLPGDIDKGNHSLEDVNGALDKVIGADVSRIIYSTSSATADDRKWRFLLFLAESISGADYKDTQDALIALMQINGIKLDVALNRTGQLVFLPNIPPAKRKKDGSPIFYEYDIKRTPLLLKLDSTSTIYTRREAIRQDVANAEEEARRRREAKLHAQQNDFGDSGDKPVTIFNKNHTVLQMLERYGYQRDGRSNDWRSPLQTSGSYATRVYDSGIWVSHSGSDIEAGIGMQKRDFCLGDAFDLYVYYEHDGDFTDAVRTYGAEIDGLAENVVFSSFSQKSESNEHAATSDGQPRPNAPEPIDVSHDALAVALGKSGWDENARYVAAWNKWLFWNGAIWEVDRRLKHMTLTREFLRDRAKDLIAEAGTEADKKRAERQSEAIRGKTTVAAVADFARSNPASVACPDDFDSDRMLLGTPGGLVDLRTGEMRAACRGDLITKQTSASPAPAGTEPTLWLQFLHEVFGGDVEVITFMQRAAGYALTGMTGEHKMLFLYGTGRNGKSVFLNTLFDLFGDYARRAPATVFLNSKFEQHSTGLAGLEGKRLVIGSELPKGKSWDEAIIKDLTGGDTMTARLMKQDYHDFDPQLTLLIAGNNQPSFAGIDEAIRARVVLVPFTITIPPEKRDTGLPDKLRAEAPAILRWAIDGALQWQQRGLDVPASIAAASNVYFEQEDILGQFLADETEDDADGFVLTKDLYTRFTQWCDEQGLKPWTRNTLKKELESRNYAHVRRNNGLGFLHIKLRFG